MSRLGILSNARSRRNQTAMPAIEALLRREPQLQHRAFTDIHDLPRCLRELAEAGVDHLIINGGDGTVHAVIGELIDRSPFAAMPPLSLVGGGMTNVIAHDVGSPDVPVEAIRRILSGFNAGRAPNVLHRHALALTRGGNARAEYGFLAGAVGFYQGTLLSRRHVHRAGLRQALATKAGILWSVMRLLMFGEGARSGLKGERVGIGLNGHQPHEAPYFLVLATTLERLMPGVMPFWGQERGGIRLTTIASPPKRFAMAALPAVRGKPRAWMKRAGYDSTRADRIALRLHSPLVLDGEVYQAGPQGHLELSVGPSIAFHRY